MKWKRILKKYEKANPEQKQQMYDTLVREIADLTNLAREMEKTI